MSFADDLRALGGTLFDSVGEAGSRYLSARIDQKITNTTQPAQTIQPVLAQPAATAPVTGVNANGDTMVQQSGATQVSLLDNKWVVYGGGGLAALLTLATVFSLAKK
jgi:hypothetical protein